MLNRTLCPVFKALADPTRRWFAECLLEGEARLSEFLGLFPITLPTVMHHLRVLEECGLVRSEKSGTVRSYSLRPQGFEEAAKWLRQMSSTDRGRACPPPPAEDLPDLRQASRPVRNCSSSAASDSTGAEQVLPRQT
jgi:DNA-binding transcriptional ArsR family regulator